MKDYQNMNLELKYQISFGLNSKLIKKISIKDMKNLVTRP